MNTRFLNDTLGWGIVLWLVGYVLGMVLFAFVPPSAIGWIILPIGIAVTLWVLLRRVAHESLQHYVTLAAAWTAIAVVFDYLFIVKALHPADGYYKLDVYVYYVLTLLLPLVVGPRKAGGSRVAAVR